MTSNAYSREWFEIFAAAAPPEQTEREVEMVSALLPPASRLLDAACGLGRHAVRLRARGHRVVGMDRDGAVLEAARRASAAVEWVRADLRRPPFRAGSFDAVLSLWQSFGYFDAAGNAAVLRALGELLAPEGVLVMDLYHRAFFERNQGERASKRGGVDVVERRTVRDGRLSVELVYRPSGGGDRFDWQLFTPREMRELAGACGLRVAHACSGFDLARAPSEEVPRVQYVLRRA